MDRGRSDRRVPNPIDVHVGSRVHLRRRLLDMSQEKLGEAIGLSFQQVQKYERGSNRISASRLFALARVVYLMGIAQDRTELDRVTNHARNVKYVRKVVNYARLRSDPRRFAAQ